MQITALSLLSKMAPVLGSQVDELLVVRVLHT